MQAERSAGSIRLAPTDAGTRRRRRARPPTCHLGHQGRRTIERRDASRTVNRPLESQRRFRDQAERTARAADRLGVEARRLEQDVDGSVGDLGGLTAHDSRERDNAAGVADRSAWPVSASVPRPSSVVSRSPARAVRTAIATRRLRRSRACPCRTRARAVRARTSRSW